MLETNTLKTKDNLVAFLNENKTPLIGIFILSSLTLIGFSFELYALPIAILGVLIAIILLYNNKWGFYLTAFLLPFSISVTIPNSTFTINTPSEPLILILFFATLYQLIIDFNKKLIIHPISIIIGCMIFLFFISVCFSNLPFISFKVWIKYFILIITCYYGILKIALDDIYFPVKILLIHVFSFLIIAIANIIEHSQLNFHREYAWHVPTPFYSDHAIYATTAAFVICLLFAIILWNFRKFNMMFILASLSLLICLIALYLSYSRAGWLSILVAFGFYFLITFKIKWYQIGIVMSILCVFALSMSDDLFMSFKRNDADSKKQKTNLEDQFKSMSNVNNDVSNLERINRWNAALRMTNESPYTGFGIGTYQFEYFPYQKPSEMTYISIRNPQAKYHSGEGGTTHSEYLLITSESGILSGFVYVSLLVVAIAVILKRTYSKNINLKDYYLLIGLGMSTVTYLVHGGFNNYLDTDKISFLFYCNLAAIVSIDLHLKNIHPAIEPKNIR